MTGTTITLRLPAQAQWVVVVQQALQTLLTGPEPVTVPGEVLPDFQLAVVEACTNVIRHGYRDRSDGRLDVAMAMADGWVRVTLRDWAPPFAWERVPPPDMSLMGDGGYGRWLIQAGSDEVRYRFADGANELVLCKRLDVPDDLPAGMPA